MKNQKCIAFILSSLLLTAGLAGCGARTAPLDSAPSRADNSASSWADNDTSSWTGDESTLYPEPPAAYGIAYALEDAESSALGDAIWRESLKFYEAFGMTYDADKNELWYNGKLVRWFEDYYPVGDDGQGGMDFFNEKGVVDVYAVRDFSNRIQHADGSYDPSGQVVALKEFSAEEFAARDIQALRKPPVTLACAGDPLTQKERQAIAAEYAAFGITYDADADQWYFRGEKIRYFFDVLLSNGEPLNSGNFQGTIRNWWQDGGTVDVYTVRDFQRLNEDQNGMLTAVEAYNKQEFDARSSAAAQFWEEPQVQPGGWNFLEESN